MAQMPIEVVDVGSVSPDSLGQAISLANAIQREFVYLSLPQGEARGLRVHAYKNADLDNLLSAVTRFRLTLAGYHPFLIAFVDTQIGSGRFTNLFWGSLPAEGLAVVTIANVPDVIVPSNRMVAYYLYFLAVHTLWFIAPAHHGHDDTRGCVFDFMENKADIRKRMKPRALCDECRSMLVGGHTPIAPQHLDALDRLFAQSGNLIRRRGVAKRRLPKVFIGSSTEGLRGLQEDSNCCSESSLTYWRIGARQFSFQSSLESGLKPQSGVL